MKVITLANEKGGVGKTTIAVHLAAGLALMGNRVILIDTDAQGNATELLGLVPEPAFYDLLVRDVAWGSVLRQVSIERYKPGWEYADGGWLALVPGNLETRNVVNGISDPFIIRKRLTELNELCDCVVFDTSPTPTLLHGSIFLATDCILFPTQLEKPSITGLIKTINHIDGFSAVREQNGFDRIQRLGIVPTQYRRSTILQTELLEQLNAEYDDVYDALPQRVAWGEAWMRSAVVWSHEPDGAAAHEAWAMVTRTARGLYVEEA